MNFPPLCKEQIEFIVNNPHHPIHFRQLVEQLTERDLHFVILNLGIDTRTPTGKFFLTVLGAFSELNREIIKEKERSGVKLAKQKGKY